MKKLMIYLSLIIALFAVLLILNHQTKKADADRNRDAANKLYQTEPEELNPATLKQLSDKNYQNIILPDDLKQSLANEESLFVYFFSPLCSHCVASTPILTDITTDMDVKVMQLNVLEYPQAFAEYNFNSTPTLVSFKDGKEQDRFVGGLVQNEAQDLLRQFFTVYAE